MGGLRINFVYKKYKEQNISNNVKFENMNQSVTRI